MTMSSPASAVSSVDRAKARLEATIAITRFAQRVNAPRLAADPPYRDHVTLRGPARLPISFSSISSAV